jgi:hypothetical protein
MAIAFFHQINQHALAFDKQKEEFADLLTIIKSSITSWKLSKSDAEKLSFVVALWAQRMDGKRNVSLFYLYSYFIAHDNFYVFHKCITAIMNSFGKNEAESFMNEILEIDGSTQAVYVVKSALSIFGEKAIGLHIKFPNSTELLKQRF